MKKLFLANVDITVKDGIYRVTQNVLVWADSEGEVWSKLDDYYEEKNERVLINYINEAIV